LPGCRGVYRRIYRLPAATRRSTRYGSGLRLWPDCHEATNEPACAADREDQCETTGARIAGFSDEPRLTLFVMDVSFISVTLLLGPILAAAPSLEEGVILVKPQFEAGREHVGKGASCAIPRSISSRWRKWISVFATWVEGHRGHPCTDSGCGRKSGISALGSPPSHFRLRDYLNSLRRFCSPSGKLSPHDSRRDRLQTEQARTRCHSA